MSPCPLHVQEEAFGELAFLGAEAILQTATLPCRRSSGSISAPAVEPAEAFPYRLTAAGPGATDATQHGDTLGPDHWLCGPCHAACAQPDCLNEALALLAPEKIRSACIVL